VQVTISPPLHLLWLAVGVILLALACCCNNNIGTEKTPTTIATSAANISSVVITIGSSSPPPQISYSFSSNILTLTIITVSFLKEVISGEVSIITKVSYY
jgi:hypothetical protein